MLGQNLPRVRTGREFLVINAEKNLLKVLTSNLGISWPTNSKWPSWPTKTGSFPDPSSSKPAGWSGHFWTELVTGLINLGHLGSRRGACWSSQSLAEIRAGPWTWKNTNSTSVKRQQAFQSVKELAWHYSTFSRRLIRSKHFRSPTTGKIASTGK